MRGKLLVSLPWQTNKCKIESHCKSLLNNQVTKRMCCWSLLICCVIYLRKGATCNSETRISLDIPKGQPQNDLTSKPYISIQGVHERQPATDQLRAKKSLSLTHTHTLLSFSLSYNTIFICHENNLLH